MARNNKWLILGAIGAALAVSTGAFGAHLLDGVVSDITYVTFTKAVRYQMYHSIALIIVSILLTQRTLKALNVSGWCFLVGIIAFSGSLYLIVFTGIQELGWITPFGGIAFVIGWVCLVYAGLQKKE
ncbi:MAG: DUF423 domain-containing protein [Promethearchaeota archaeon]